MKEITLIPTYLSFLHLQCFLQMLHGYISYSSCLDSTKDNMESWHDRAMEVKFHIQVFNFSSRWRCADSFTCLSYLPWRKRCRIPVALNTLYNSGWDENMCTPGMYLRIWKETAVTLKALHYWQTEETHDKPQSELTVTRYVSN
jgi:hypothetical protein